MPIIQRRQLLGVLVVQQRELRQYDESEESFLVTLATQMAAILSQSQVTALFGQYRQTRIRALPAAPGVAIATGWQDATMPLMEQVYEASTLDTSLERERLTGALEEAANEFRRYSKRFAAGAQKDGGHFRSVLTPAFRCQTASRTLRRGRQRRCCGVGR